MSYLICAQIIKFIYYSYPDCPCNIDETEVKGHTPPYGYSGVEEDFVGENSSREQKMKVDLAPNVHYAVVPMIRCFLHKR